MAKKFLTTGQLAKLSHLSPATIFRAITQHKLEAATTPGGHYRIPTESAAKFLEKNNIPVTKSQRTASITILIVEDNPAELHMFERMLSSDSSLKVETATSGYAAGFLTQSLKPDIILLDIFLGDVDGREVAKMIRSQQALRHTKIIAITGSIDPQELRAIKSWGFDGFISKPISIPDLHAAIHEILK